MIKTINLGYDAECISALLKIHAVSDPVILDVTYNTGKMWKGCEYQPHICSDLYPKTGSAADFTALPLQSASVDVVVFDPPHLPNAAASKNSSKMWEDTYGIRANDPSRTGDNVSPMFLPFLYEAHRVLRTGGIVLAKISDLVHNHRHQWQHVDFINTCPMAGFQPCDMMINANPSAGNLKSSKWMNQRHLRNSHVFWIVARKGVGNCERK